MGTSYRTTLFGVLCLLIGSAGCSSGTLMETGTRVEVAGETGVSVSREAARQDGTLRIGSAGDSITQGSRDYDSWRRDLWHLLQRHGHRHVDFVGRWRENHGNVPPPNPDFDPDHTAAWGRRADFLADQLKKAPPADVMLVHLGHNDIGQGQSNQSTLRDLERVVQTVRDKNPSVTVLLAQLIPSCGGLAPGIRRLNREIPGLARRLSTPHSRVVAVDHTRGFNPRQHTYDCTHPNEQGQQVMAENWYRALRPFLDEASGPGDGGGGSAFSVPGRWYRLESAATGAVLRSASRHAVGPARHGKGERPGAGQTTLAGVAKY